MIACTRGLLHITPQSLDEDDEEEEDDDDDDDRFWRFLSGLSSLLLLLLLDEADRFRPLTLTTSEPGRSSGCLRAEGDLDPDRFPLWDTSGDFVLAGRGCDLDLDLLRGDLDFALWTGDLDGVLRLGDLERW